jgi:hypothetical protein
MRMSFRSGLYFGMCVYATLWSIILTGCVQDRTAVLDETLARYEEAGLVEFLPAVHDTAAGAIETPRAGFRFVDADAEALFREQFGFAPATAEPRVKRPVVSNAEGSEWFCVGASYHEVRDADELVSWGFWTDNNSSRNKFKAPVIGTVFHPNGGRMTCNASAFESFNTCSIYTPLISGWSSSVGDHFCCEKRSLSVECTKRFYTADRL